ncbi:hypothetical protein [Vibrio breoganii]|uniref:hypothetical protein n=1 Tax=Vibrio breoganii TaxID=553239 RepID=UPI000C81F745|nr:hypothetical protein [Vibrio breoganii]PML91931.1 hypothetical protein BCT64_16975 [Vibrio breoganii]PMN64232.1 hypothetical protein BCT28_08370 [Vibrio breoganii]
MNEIEKSKEELYRAHNNVLRMVNNNSLQVACFKLARSVDLDTYDEREKELIKQVLLEAERRCESAEELIRNDKHHPLHSRYVELYSLVLARKDYQTVDEIHELYNAGRRMHCPLCNSTSQQGYGFKLPTGLERHLVGWTKGSQCAVMHTTMKLFNLERMAETTR